MRKSRCAGSKRKGDEEKRCRERPRLQSACDGQQRRGRTSGGSRPSTGGKRGTTVVGFPREESGCSAHAGRGISTSRLDPPSVTSLSSAWRGAKEISGLTESTANPVFDVEKIREILPHRFPFLLVDKVLEFEPGKRAVGVKQISANEDQFNGHFPHRAILPGVLQVEALAQLAGIVALQPPISNGQGNFFFAGVDGVKWKKPVVPGDTLVMEVELTAWKEKFGIAKATGKAFVDGKPAIEVGEMTFALVR